MDNNQQTMNKENSELYLKAQEETIALCVFGDNDKLVDTADIEDDSKSNKKNLNNTVARVCEIVIPDNFLDEKLNSIMQAIFSVYRRDEIVSVMSIAGELEKSGELNFIGGVLRLYQLHKLGAKVSLSNTPTMLANIVKELHVKFLLKTLLTENSSNFTDDSGITAREGIEGIQSELSEHMLSLNDDTTMETAEEFMGGYHELLAQRRKTAEENLATSGGLQGIPTLLPSLNKYTSGFTPGQLITIGAKTGIGKSVFAIMSLIAALKSGKSVLFFSLEMSQSEIFDRIVANMAEVKLNNLKNGNISDDEEERISKVVKELKEAPLVIDTDPRSTVDSVRAKAIRQQQSEQGLDFIIVDYLQLLSPSQSYNSRQELVADLSRNMKLMAKSLDIPVMILTQLNRGKTDDDEDDTPKLDQIRESGAIAQDSDIVILLHRRKNVDNKIPKTYILLEKNRSGESDKTITCHTELAYSDFREVKASELSEDNTENNDDNENSDSNDNNDTVTDFYTSNLDSDFDDVNDDFFDEE